LGNAPPPPTLTSMLWHALRNLKRCDLGAAAAAAPPPAAPSPAPAAEPAEIAPVVNRNYFI
jgi:hypothetical protein